MKTQRAQKILDLHNFATLAYFFAIFALKF